MLKKLMLLSLVVGMTLPVVASENEPNYKRLFKEEISLVNGFWRIAMAGSAGFGVCAILKQSLAKDMLTVPGLCKMATIAAAILAGIGARERVKWMCQNYYNNIIELPAADQQDIENNITAAELTLYPFIIIGCTIFWFL
jgi:hypothetical protein